MRVSEKQRSGALSSNEQRRKKKRQKPDRENQRMRVPGFCESQCGFMFVLFV